MVEFYTAATMHDSWDLSFSDSPIKGKTGKYNPQEEKVLDLMDSVEILKDFGYNSSREGRKANLERIRFEALSSFDTAIAPEERFEEIVENEDEQLIGDFSFSDVDIEEFPDEIIEESVEQEANASTLVTFREFAEEMPKKSAEQEEKLSSLRKSAEILSDFGYNSSKEGQATNLARIRSEALRNYDTMIAPEERFVEIDDSAEASPAAKSSTKIADKGHQRKSSMCKLATITLTAMAALTTASFSLFSSYMSE